MELVSANTRNYLFLTMSQYNEQNGLVRARCVMRRDQAFWQGGNSFVACESFRITSSPSKGGLYYTILPDSYYVGAQKHTTDDQDDEKYEQLKVGNHFTITSNKLSGGADPLVVGDTLNMQFTMGVAAAGARPTDITASHPETVMPIFGSLWNNHSLFKNSKVQMVCGASSINATVTNNPLSSIEGGGGGPDGLFYPISGSWLPISPDPETKLLAGDQITSGLYTLGYPNLDPAIDLVAVVTRLLGSVADFELCTGPDGLRNSVPADLRAPGISFLGPKGLVVSGFDPWNVDDFGNPSTLKTKIYWDTDNLAVGSTVWQIVDVGGLPTKQFGTVTALPGWIWKQASRDPGDVNGVQLMNCQWEMSPAYIAWLAANNQFGNQPRPNPANPLVPALKEHAIKNMMSQSWVMAKQHMPNTIKVNVQLSVDADTPVANLATFRAACAASSVTSMNIKKITHRTSSRIERRACPQGESKYVYTPNELYYLFNKPTSDEKNAVNPYVLQTHENGGFKVDWDGTMNDFYMSAEMHEAMGFNDYFEYNIINTNETVKNWNICLQKLIIGQASWDQSYGSSLVHLVASSVYVAGDGPLVPINANTVALGTAVRTSDNAAWIVVSKQQITTADQSSDTKKVYPTSSLDLNGDERLTWSNLPKATMGNTQQVSVESFGTYSGINIVIPNLPFQPMLGTASDDRILASLRLPFQYGTENTGSGAVSMTDFSYYGDLLFNSDSSRSYLRITTDQQLYDCDVEARLIRRDGGMEVLSLPYKGQFEIKLRFLQTQ